MKSVVALLVLGLVGCASTGTAPSATGRDLWAAPIALDSADVPHSGYLDEIRKAIREKWGYPCVANETTRQCEYKTTKLLIEFGLKKDGTVPYVKVLESSGYAIYDEFAVNAVKKAAPFPPIPDWLSKTGVPIHATFNYVVEQRSNP